MKYIKSYLTLVVVCIAVCCCQNSLEIDNQATISDSKLNVTGRIATNSSKVGMSDNESTAVNITWNVDDVVFGYYKDGDGKNTVVYKVTEVTGGVAKFANIAGSEANTHDGTIFYLVYNPTIKLENYESIVFPTEGDGSGAYNVDYTSQAGTLEEIAANNCYMYGTGTVNGTSLELTFHSLISLIKFTNISVNGPVINGNTEFSLSAPNLKNTGTITFDGESANISGGESGAIQFKASVNSNKGTAYIAVPNGTDVGNMKITTTISQKKYNWQDSSDELVADGSKCFTHSTDKILKSSAAKFYVGNGKYIVFAPGNLQYIAGDGTESKPKWQFAENQYTSIGNKSGNTTAYIDASHFTPRSVQKDSIDLFGWATSGNNENYASRYYEPWRANGQNTFFTLGNNVHLTKEAKTDWGINNIYNPKEGNWEEDVWRTITKAELDTILIYRTNTGLKCGDSNVNCFNSKVNGIKGLMIVPDDTVWPLEVSLTNNNSINLKQGISTESYNVELQECDFNTLIDCGYVFLPVTGYHLQEAKWGVQGGKYSINNPSQDLHYWTATSNTNEFAYALVCNSSSSITATGKYTKCAVRLVKDVAAE